MWYKNIAIFKNGCDVNHVENTEAMFKIILDRKINTTFTYTKLPKAGQGHNLQPEICFNKNHNK